MSKIIALEWDTFEARAIVANVSGKRVNIDQAFSFELSPESESEGASQSVTQRIVDELAKRKIGKGDALVCVARAGIELRMLEHPPAPPEELPDMVRFQAQRQFSSMTDEWALDFVPIAPANENGQPRALAAAISPQLFGQIRKTCDSAHLTLKHLALRPFAASALARHEMPDDACRMIVDWLGQEADLTVLKGNDVAFTRTVRIPRSLNDESVIKLILQEIKRTHAAFSNQTNGKEVDYVVFCGDGERVASVDQHIEDQLGLKVRFLNPFDVVKLGSSIRSSVPEYPGRFAPLVGMLLDHASGGTHTIDFLNPRKAPEPPSKLRRNIIVGSAIAASILALVGVPYMLLKVKSDQLKSLEMRRGTLIASEKDAIRRIDEVGLIDEWENQNIVWLDEMADLSDAFPLPDDAVVHNLTFAMGKSGTGDIRITGRASDNAVIKQLETELIEKGYAVKSGQNVKDGKDPHYEWTLAETVTVKAKEPE